MRIPGFLVMSVCMLVFTNLDGQTITMKVKEASLKFVFKEIRRQTEYHFTFPSQLVSKVNHLTFDVKDASITEVLDICIKDQPIAYKIEGKLVTISEKITGPQRPSFPQLLTFRGVVKN